jgi:eukaryotic-like serine/threonine-protein kinase
LSDAEALAWLDRLLSASEAERAESLAALATSNRELHDCLQRMLLTALSPDRSQLLAQPVIEGLARIADAARALAPGDVLAGYRLLRELGRGGMSVVWLAERADGAVKRNVALKMPMFVLQGAGVERFTRERDALAALSHPHVARLYDAGVLESGQPFIVLEHVDGESITVHCDARRLDVRARLELFLQVLGAVEHAHKHLIVHRDLKPSNILVDGEGRVRLLDFGIAKLLGEAEGAVGLTQQLGNVMTPQYAAPEQIRGAAISTSADVYSLGMLLHELLTGTLPYPAAAERPTLVEVLEALSRGEARRASQAPITPAAAEARGDVTVARLRRELANDLDTIIGKALRLKSEDRYASVAQLADDLRRRLRNQPITARPPSLRYVLGLALKRHRLAASVGGIGMALLAGASVVAWYQFQEARAHAARTATVRAFMFELVNDAEPREGQTGDVTGKQMLDGAVRRARAEFPEQPQLRGELLSELGRMYLRLGASASAMPVLEEALTTLEAVAPRDDPALNKCRGFLAGALMRAGGDIGRIETLAQTAHDACDASTTDCYKARAYANNLLSQVAARRGDNPRALSETRAFATNTELAFGARHAETAIALMSVAITARNAGQLREAGVAMQRATEVAQGLNMRAVDRAQLERTMATVDLDLGHYTQARDRLLALIESTDNAAERALQLRLLANVYAEMGEGHAAVQAATSALTLLSADARPDLVTFARQALARGLALQGDTDRALAEIDAVITALLSGGRKAGSFEVLRARRYRAWMLTLADRDAEARTALRDIAREHETAPTSPVERGLVFDLLGEIEARGGDRSAAGIAHRAAREALAEQLPEEHPYLAKNAALRRAHP